MVSLLGVLEQERVSFMMVLVKNKHSMFLLLIANCCTSSRQKKEDPLTRVSGASSRCRRRSTSSFVVLGPWWRGGSWPLPAGVLRFHVFLSFVRICIYLA